MDRVYEPVIADMRDARGSDRGVQSGCRAGLSVGCEPSIALPTLSGLGVSSETWRGVFAPSLYYE